MSAKIITYDLLSPGQDYSELINEIKKYPDWAKITESSWIISTNDSTKTIRDNLSQYLDSNDRIFVAKLTSEAAWRNVIGQSDAVKRILNS